MALETPVWEQDGTYSANSDRALIEALATEGVADVLGGGLKVTQRGAGANMTVDVAAGSVFITGDAVGNQGRYLCRSTAVTNVAIGAAPSAGLSRIDLVIAEVRDDAHDSSGFSDWQVRVVAGTPNASPAAPALPASSVELARVTVPSGTASILNAAISDRRVQSVGTGNRVQRFSDAGNGAVAFSATTQMAGFTIPAQAVDGWATLWGHLRVDKTAPSDEFRVHLKANTVIVGTDVCSGLASHMAHPVGEVQTVAGVAMPVGLHCVRQSGAGTATTFTDGTVNRIQGIWVPDA